MTMSDTETKDKQHTEGHGEHACDHGHNASRRKFLWTLSIGLGGLSQIVAGVPILGYLLAPAVTIAKDDWVDAGSVDDYKVGETRLVKLDNPTRRPWDGKSGHVAAYVRRVEDDTFTVFAVNCTHLGCPVSWFAQSNLFLCPCHGGVYYANGDRAAGPPPRGLYKYDHRVDKKRNRLQIRVGHLPTLHDLPTRSKA